MGPKSPYGSLRDEKPGAQEDWWHPYGYTIEDERDSSVDCDHDEDEPQETDEDIYGNWRAW